MRADIIVRHEDWQKEKFPLFLAKMAQKLDAALPKNTSEVSGEVEAFVSEGRWVAECPATGCLGALCVSEQIPLFYCPHCGNSDNDGSWYGVVFPIDREMIEEELLKRPARDGFRAINRNWRVGESIEKLRMENAVMGIS